MHSNNSSAGLLNETIASWASIAEMGGSFVAALGQLDKELADEAALLGYSPKFVDRLLAKPRRR